MLEAFTSALLLITSQELGDKTFFIALILAMHHPRRWVFCGSIAALAAMTAISVGAGHLLGFLPQAVTHRIFIALCFGFGGWLCWQASRMTPADEQEPLQEASQDVKSFEAQDHHWGKRQQALKTNASWAIVLEAFILTFVAEWGDRTQLATVAIAMRGHPVGVIAGGIAGHAVCTSIAVVGGRWAAGRISERVITWIGGLLFILFGAIAIFSNPSAL
ncbi:TMEM165/GDT1 family protein [Altericista sp. CCNU0014]|uniref:TMEM165/GDT1 family protein n=1 Tax=Altericista sp. CCNU0014 TaxID=3082949 RepID=UPI00384C47DF